MESTLCEDILNDGAEHLVMVLFEVLSEVLECLDKLPLIVSVFAVVELVSDGVDHFLDVLGGEAVSDDLQYLFFDLSTGCFEDI